MKTDNEQEKEIDFLIKTGNKVPHGWAWGHSETTIINGYDFNELKKGKMIHHVHEDESSGEEH